ncbi:MAG: flavin reductase [Lachnospiraceae bacterium]|nr:flavin reductase [Lachnospiraceae bacterium]
MTFETDIFQQFDKQWALLTAGTAEDFNTMTISWGGMGTLWHKPVVTVYVRDSRYTYEYMENNEYFTVSFYPQAYKKTLGVLGTKSGREMDKIHDSGLTPKGLPQSVTFEEAEVTLVCRKLFQQELEVDHMPEDVAKAFYEGMAPHVMVIGEVVEVIQ